MGRPFESPRNSPACQTEPLVFPALQRSREHQHAVKGHRLKLWEYEPCLGGASGGDGSQFSSALKAESASHAIASAGHAAEIYSVFSG